MNGAVQGGSRVFVLLVLSPCTILGFVVKATSGMFKSRERTLVSSLYEVVWASELAWTGSKTLATPGVRKQTIRSVTIRDPGHRKNVWLRERMRNLHFMQSSPHCYWVSHVHVSFLSSVLEPSYMPVRNNRLWSCVLYPELNLNRKRVTRNLARGKWRSWNDIFKPHWLSFRSEIQSSCR